MTGQPTPGLPEVALSRTDWDALKFSGVAPRHVTQGVATDAQIEAFFVGCRMLRLDRGVFPQMLHVVDTVAAGRRYASILLPRQSAKTTSVEAFLLGLCATLPGLQVAYTMGTTAKAGRDHFLKKIVRPIEKAQPDPETRDFKLRKGAGMERIDWDNGSTFQVAGTEEDLRGSSFDIIWLDEAQELDGRDAEDWMAAAGPTQLTRAGYIIDTPLIILSGTAGRTRKGNLLWDYIESGRAGDPDVAVLDYSAGTDLTVEDVEDWEMTEPLIAASHPGVGTLTTLPVIRADFGKMPHIKFLAEYLSVFGDEGATQGIFVPAKWRDCESKDAEFPDIPMHAALGMALNYHGTAAAITASWREDDDTLHMVLVDYREGTRWLSERVGELVGRYPWKVHYDNRASGAINAEVATMKREGVPTTRLIGDGTREVATGAALLVREVHSGHAVHYGQAQLDQAALSARRREFVNVAGWAFGRGDEGDDICAIEAMSLSAAAAEKRRQGPTRKIGFQAA